MLGWLRCLCVDKQYTERMHSNEKQPARTCVWCGVVVVVGGWGGGRGGALRPRGGGLYGLEVSSRVPQPLEELSVAEFMQQLPQVRASRS